MATYRGLEWVEKDCLIQKGYTVNPRISPLMAYLIVSICIIFIFLYGDLFEGELIRGD